MFTAVCSQCTKKVRARTRTKVLSLMREHQWKAHRAWLTARIKAGRKQSENGNPTVAMALKALLVGVRVALPLIRAMKERRYENLTKAMETLEPVLPKGVTTTWRAADAARSAIKEIKGKKVALK